MKVEGTKEFEASRERVWAVISDPESMSKLMPGVEGFEIRRGKLDAAVGQLLTHPGNLSSASPTCVGSWRDTIPATLPGSWSWPPSTASGCGSPNCSNGSPVFRSAC